MIKKNIRKRFIYIIQIYLHHSLIIVPDVEVLEGMEKINLKKLYSIFRDTKSHGVVSLHFLCSVGIFFCL